MGEDRRSAVRRSEIEVSTLPEVAALATELTLIFKSLGISQQQYAIRTNYDKSYISRFLNGRRVATQEFIDRLLREVEIHRQASVTDETRARLGHLRDSALRVYDPDLFRLETMRSEVRKYQREVKRLLLHQEALEGLLERRKAEAEESRRELTQAQSDWIADRIRNDAQLLTLKGENQRHQDERQGLLEEIARLRAELKTTVAQKLKAERRCALLEAQAAAVEVEVAEKRESEGVDDVGVPIEFVQLRLQEAEENEIYRELAEFALSRSGADVARLSLWLFDQGSEGHAEQLVADYCRQRPVRNTVGLVLDLEMLKQANPPEKNYISLIAQVRKDVARRSIEGLLEFCELYAKAHRHQGGSEEIIHLDDFAYRWFGHHRRLPERAQRFFDVVDHLAAIGEPKASADLVRRPVTLTGISSVYGRIIAESGREAEIRILVSSFLESIKRRGSDAFHLIPRQITKAYEYSNPLLVELLLADLCNVFGSADLCKILMGSLNSTDVTDRIIAAIVASGLAREVHDYLARELSFDAVKIAYSPEVRRLLKMLSSG